MRAAEVRQELGEGLQDPAELARLVLEEGGFGGGWIHKDQRDPSAIAAEAGVEHSFTWPLPKKPVSSLGSHIESVFQHGPELLSIMVISGGDIGVGF